MYQSVSPMAAVNVTTRQHLLVLLAVGLEPADALANPAFGTPLHRHHGHLAMVRNVGVTPAELSHVGQYLKARQQV